MTKPIANSMLLCCSILWGSGYIITKMALNAGTPAGFMNFFRGTVFALLVAAFFHKKIRIINLHGVKCGLIAGGLNFGGYILQTVGMKYTTPSNNVFLGAAYVAIVPFIVWIFYKKPLKLRAVIAILICLAGMSVLTGLWGHNMKPNIGDLYSFLSAFFYAGAIAYLGHSIKKAEPAIVTLMMACVQAAGGLIYFFIVDGGELSGVQWSVALPAMLYMAVVCSFAAQTMQVLAQRHTSATTAGLLIMLEGFFGSVFSVAFSFEPFTVRLIAGGAMIMTAFVFLELDLKMLRKGKDEGQGKDTDKENI